jgi:hypothetical protein
MPLHRAQSCYFCGKQIAETNEIQGHKARLPWTTGTRRLLLRPIEPGRRYLRFASLSCLRSTGCPFRVAVTSTISDKLLEAPRCDGSFNSKLA